MSDIYENDFPPLARSPFLTAQGREIKRLRAELAAMRQQRDEAVELYTDLLRRLSGSASSAPPRAAFLSGDAREKCGKECGE